MDYKKELQEYLEHLISECQRHIDYLKNLHAIIDSTSKLNLGPAMPDDSLALSLNVIATTGQLELASLTRNLIQSSYRWEAIYLVRQGFAVIKKKLFSLEGLANERDTFIANNPELLPLAQTIDSDLTTFKIHVSEVDFDAVVSTSDQDSSQFNLYYKALSGVDVNKAVLILLEFLLILKKIFEFSTECLLAGQSGTLDVKAIEERIHGLELRLKSIYNALRNQN